MRVFVTGASGHIASAVIPELVSAGHQVVGLARSDKAAETVIAAGATVHRGSLDDLDALREAAKGADGVIHLAFKHEAMVAGDFAGAVDADMRAIEAMADALAGTGKPFVSTSGTLLLSLAGLGRVGTEADKIAAGPRIDAENTVVALAERGVRSSVIRLPPTVHSSLDHHGYVPILIAIARDKGAAGYVGDGSNRWPAVHTVDAAHLYRLALEGAPAGSRLHAVGDEGVPFRQIAEVIGRHLDVPAVSIPAEEAAAYFDFLALFVGLDNPTSSAQTQTLLDWHPRHSGLIDDLDEGHYFTAPAGTR
ncbi:MAG TPA: SDR family oxidoreductase [Streptosporangiaceae bacterium]|nr:SDR family oxidoreductase [Streptosporangiaceae bacterium]